MGEKANRRTAEALLRRAESAIEQGEAKQGLTLIEQALHADPQYEAALRRALDVTVHLKLHAQSMVFRHRLLAFSQNDDEKTAQLRALVHDATALAIEALHSLQAQHIPGFDTLDRLRAAHETLGDLSTASDVMVTQAEAIDSPHDRAAAMVRAADFCAERTGNTARAVALYEAAIADDPAIPGAFEAIERVLIEKGDWKALEKAYRRQVKRLGSANAKPKLTSLLGRLAELCHDRLNDKTGAIEALSKRVKLEPSNVDAQAVLSTLLEQDGQVERSCRVLEMAAWHAPTRSETYHSLFRMFSHTQKHDRAFQACAALVHLGDADLDEQMVYQQYRPEAGLQPTKTVDEASWAELYPLEHDANVRAVLRAIGPATIAYQVSQLEAKGKLPELGDQPLCEPESSTVSVVRSLVWASKVLQIELPPLYVRPDLASGISAVAGRQQAIVLGNAVLSGRSIAELAFLVGRHLAYFRPEHRILMYFGSMSELTALVTTTIRMSIAAEDESVKNLPLASAIGQEMSSDAWEQIRNAVKAVESSGSKIDLVGYVRSLEIAATRIGLLLCGDLPTAGKLLSSDVREVAGLRAADRMRDLLPYAISDQYAALRGRLGVEAG